MSADKPTSGDDEFVITSLGVSTGADERVPTPGAGVATRTSRLPALIEESPLARELVIHAASFVHGVRRAVAPDTILKVRAEMKRELKRARKARKAEMKAALREYRARHRADVPPDTGGAR